MISTASDPVVAIVGSGPASLMAATALSDRGIPVEVFEKRAGFGRKLLVAGSSGLNISHDLPLAEFAAQYTSPSHPDFFRMQLHRMAPSDWISFIEKRLLMETFLGTSSRYFVKEMKASNLLRRWMDLLSRQGVKFHSRMELVDFESDGNASEVALTFQDSSAGRITRTFSSAVLALGGGSWEDETPSWARWIQDKEIAFSEFFPSNVGYEVAWPEKLLQEAVRKPLKSIVLRTSRGEKAGELLITEYGLEGTPIYFLGIAGKATLDLKPGLSERELLAKLAQSRENLSAIRRVDQKANLGEAAFALLFHLAPAEVKKDLGKLVSFIKNVPLELLRPRPLSESISSRGGVRMTELTESLELKRYPGIHVTGEMLDWDAPTGGFLIQGCVLQGRIAGEAIAKRIAQG